MTEDRNPSIDPVTTEVIRNAVTSIAEEMNANLIRSAYSPNIKERRDCSCAVFDPAGRMLAQAENVPVHLGAMPFSVAAALDRFSSETLEPGDAIALNDPYHGGAHLPDITLIAPVFSSSTLIGYAANRAHHADIGGIQAGSVSADSTEIYQEGLRIPPIKLVSEGTINDGTMSLLLANVRTPDERRGDLRAQRAANETARSRLGELVSRYGVDTLQEATDEIHRYSERRMRGELSDLPNGEYRFSDVLDDDGHGRTELRIEVAITIDGGSITVDFSGTDRQTAGPINAVRAVTASATYFAIRCVTDPTIPPNHGCYRPINVVAPEGTIVNARPPAAVVGGNLETSQRVTDVVLGGLADAAPERAVAAGQGTMNNLTIGGTDPETDEAFAFYETIGGGFGGRSNGDGMDGVHVHMTNTLNTPIEVIESTYPVVIEEYALRSDTGGAGRYRGGLGVRRQLRAAADDVNYSVLAERRHRGPYGIDGGDAGAPGRDMRWSDGDWERIESKSTGRLETGDRLCIDTPGGGGYGDPEERSREAVIRDLELDKISIETARTVYGVEIDDG